MKNLIFLTTKVVFIVCIVIVMGFTVMLAGLEIREYQLKIFDASDQVQESTVKPIMESIIKVEYPQVNFYYWEGYYQEKFGKTIINKPLSISLQLVKEKNIKDIEAIEKGKYVIYLDLKSDNFHRSNLGYPSWYRTFFTKVKIEIVEMTHEELLSYRMFKIMQDKKR